VRRLADTIAARRPRLLVLDPFVRLHRIDENAAAEVAPLLADLRALQRRYQCAVCVVHHARKGAGHARGGQALRGSSELRAWGDSNLYLRRQGERLCLATEHRAAPSSENIALELRAHGSALALELVDGVEEKSPAGPPSVHERITQALASAETPLTRDELRERARLRTQTLGQALAELTAQGRVSKGPAGYRLAEA